MIRSYSELRTIPNIEDRFQYLHLLGSVGRPTFGYERWLNQRFYTSKEWRQVRYHVIARDEGCDLGIEEFPILSVPRIHHMNPLTREDIIDGDPSIMDPEFLITVSLKTHNAIHFGDESQLPRLYIERSRGDTKLW